MSKKRTSVTDQVRRAILTSGMSRYAICKASGVEQAALSRFMAGKTSLTLTTLDRMADVLGLDLVVRKPKRKRGPKSKKGR